MRATFLLIAMSWLAGVLAGQCECRVTNIGSVSITTGTCTEYPGGPSLPCLSAAVTSVPGQGLPDHGRCLKVPQCPQENARGCTYSARRFVVTAAPCAASCFTIKQVDLVKWDGETAGLPLIDPGQTKNYDAEPTGIGTNCNTPESSIYVRFYDQDGNLVFELRARYGCSDCRANR